MKTERVLERVGGDRRPQSRSNERNQAKRLVFGMLRGNLGSIGEFIALSSIGARKSG
jgi:hypothetical protein